MWRRIQKFLFAKIHEFLTGFLSSISSSSPDSAMWFTWLFEAVTLVVLLLVSLVQSPQVVPNFSHFYLQKCPNMLQVLRMQVQGGTGKLHDALWCWVWPLELRFLACPSQPPCCLRSFSRVCFTQPIFIQFVTGIKCQKRLSLINHLTRHYLQAFSCMFRKGLG